jgi:hypothetical protein
MTELQTAVGRILRASVSRAAELRRSERTRFSVCERRRSRRVPSAMREQRDQ